MSLDQRDHGKIEWTERMWGYVSEGAVSFEEGYVKGKKAGNELEYVVNVHIDDLDAFLAGPDQGPAARHVPMTGKVSCPLFGGHMRRFQGGAAFGLYWKDPQTGERRMSYDFQVRGRNNIVYTFSGYKRIVHQPGEFDILEDHTTLYATLTWTENGQSKTAQGIIYFHPIPDLVPMLLSMLLPKDEGLLGLIKAIFHWRSLLKSIDHWRSRLKSIVRFFLFCSEEESEVYLKNILPATYVTEYRNWVCRGTCRRDGQANEFFLFSGIHGKGFPWGGEKTFSDIGLIVREAQKTRRFALSDSTIANLKLDFKDQIKGTYKYQGDLFEIIKGYQVSFTDMGKGTLPDHLRRTPASLALTFTPQHVETKNVPFEVAVERIEEFLRDVKGKASILPRFGWISAILKAVDEWMQKLKPLGYTADIFMLSHISGSLVLDGATYEVAGDGTFAEGEYGRIESFTVPALYENYFCAVEPAYCPSSENTFRIQIRSGTLPAIGRSILHFIEDQLGKIIGTIAYMDYQVVSKKNGTLEHDLIKEKEKADKLIQPMATLLEINNNCYPDHRIFQRCIVSLPGMQGKEALALEENMAVLDLEPSAGTQRTTRVAAINGKDRFDALDQVLKATGFFDVLEKVFAKSGKTKETFSIVIKPNFSFMYSLTDISTFADPALVRHLINRIYKQGFGNITLAEARSTYDDFFDNRDVKTLARYLGYLGENYKIVDMSEGYVQYDSPAASGAAGPPVQRDVHPVWRDADFRISFAKNKTHAYAYYTLTIKNIYGALPRANKFKEYHCNRQEFGDEPIYTPAIELIQDFPVHFGFVDAYFSADGIFGVFADRQPRCTGTIIGGEDLVAVDWIGASKMGLDPQLSMYMQLAIKAFGKPEITLVGDYSFYPDWRNLPVFMPKATTAIMDRNYAFGLFVYASFIQTDPFFTFKLDDRGLKLVRLFSIPMRKALLVGDEMGQITWEGLEKVLTGLPSLIDF